jgi:hypothetical protein
MSTQTYGQAPAQPDPFASPDKLPAVSWRSSPGVDVPPGTTQRFQITATARQVESRDFETGQIKRWDPKPGQAVGDPKWSVVTEVTDPATGEAKALWCDRGSAMFVALKSAQQNAGQQFAPGGTLAVTFTGFGVRKDGRTDMLGPKQFSAVYTPPAPGVGADVFAEPHAAPPAAAPAQQYAAPVQQYAPQPVAAQSVQQYAAPVAAAPQPAAQPVQAPIPAAAVPAASAFTPEQLAAFAGIIQASPTVAQADATLTAIGQDPGAVRAALNLPPY